MRTVVGGDHLTVNHSKWFVNKRTGVNSQKIEAVNGVMKNWFAAHGRACGRSEKSLWNNIAQFTWEQWFSDGTGTMKFGMFFLAMFDKWRFV
jgi:hypothetical protein